MTISVYTVTERLHYSENEKTQLRKCLRTHAEPNTGCCPYLWEKIFSCSNQSSWDLALKTMKARISYDPNCPNVHRERMAEFLLRYLVKNETSHTANMPLLTSLMREPVDDIDVLVSQVDVIDFFDLYHRVPYSEDAQLSYPDHRTLLGLFKGEFQKLESATQSFYNELITIPDFHASRQSYNLRDGLIDITGDQKDKTGNFGLFDVGISLANALLQRVSPILREDEFERLDIQIAYKLFKTLAKATEYIESFHETMRRIQSGRFI